MPVQRPELTRNFRLVQQRQREWAGSKGLLFDSLRSGARQSTRTSGVNSISKRFAEFIVAGRSRAPAETSGSSNRRECRQHHKLGRQRPSFVAVPAGHHPFRATIPKRRRSLNNSCSTERPVVCRGGLAQILGVDDSTLARWETGECVLTGKHLRAA
jgi:hypothetical protein